MAQPSVRGRHLEALRTVALHPRGLRLSSHPTLMRALVELGYVAERPARYAQRRRDETAWFLTPAGRELLDVLGTGEHG